LIQHFHEHAQAHNENLLLFSLARNLESLIPENENKKTFGSIFLLFFLYHINYDVMKDKKITLPRKTLIAVPPIEYARRTTNSGG
jgi:hypothetical protein